MVDVTVFYLEMLAPSDRFVLAPRSELTVVHVQSPTVQHYRSLYNAVFTDPRNELHVLHVDGRSAGFAELDRRQPNEIELAQFGLIRELIGQGLGKWFLQWTIDKAWSYGPKRFWLHTCTLDHPNALPNYRKAGFVLYKQEAIRREL